jgi:outer membrane protein assembly factor BamD
MMPGGWSIFGTLRSQVFWFTIFAFTVCILGGCGRKQVRIHLDAPDQYELAIHEYERKHYSEAAEGFQRVVLEHPGSDLVDAAQFYLAECHFLEKDYIGAAAEYRYLIDIYPESLYRDDATYRLGLCVFRQSPSYSRDQTKTEETVEIFEEFLIRYPDSEWRDEVVEALQECRNKLARKELENGRLYLKLHRYYAAQVYFQYVLDEYPDSDVVPEATLLLAESMDKQDLRDEARELYAQLAEDSLAGRYSEEAQKRLSEMDEDD